MRAAQAPTTDRAVMDRCHAASDARGGTATEQALAAVAAYQRQKHTPGPWEYVPSTEHHGPYVAAPYGGDICDCYTMSNLSALSWRNGGDSKPVHFFGEMADANARLIAAAPDLDAAAGPAITALAFAQERAFNERDELAYRQITAAKDALIAAQNKARGCDATPIKDVTPASAGGTDV